MPKEVGLETLTASSTSSHAFCFGDSFGTGTAEAFRASVGSSSSDFGACFGTVFGDGFAASLGTAFGDGFEGSCDGLGSWQNGTAEKSDKHGHINLCEMRAQEGTSRVRVPLAC